MPKTYLYDGSKLIIKDEEGNIIATPAVGAYGIPVDQLDAFIKKEGLVPEVPKEMPAAQPVEQPATESPDVVKEPAPATKIEKPNMVVVTPPPQEEPQKPSMWQDFISGIKKAFEPKEMPEKKMEAPKEKKKPEMTEREKKSEQQFKKTMGNEYNQLKKLEEYLKQTESQ